MNDSILKINEETLDALLYLSRLSPESIDNQTLKNQVEQIVQYFDVLTKYDDAEDSWESYRSTDVDSLREDVIDEGLAIADVKKISEEFMDGYFRVPKVLGEGT